MAKNKFLKNLNVNQKLDSTYMFTKTKENKYIGNFEIICRHGWSYCRL